MAHDKQVDDVSGVEMTGHEWDGLRELNNPLPRWWLWTFYVTCAWAVVYWVLMPSWPLLDDYLRGVRGHSQRAVVMEEVAALQAQRATAGAGLQEVSLEEIQQTPDLLQFAMANGAAAFGDNCAACHGSGGQGATGYPNLNDDVWLWGGTLDEIHQTLLYGIRAEHDETRMGDMPAFGRDGILNRQEIRATANHVLTLSGQEPEEGADLALGEELFVNNCAACHGESGEGMRELGSANLADHEWLYGGSLQAVMASIDQGRAGVMPAWDARLDPVTIKSLAVYVHALGGGE
ncbi:cytochrome-c oxidase, cbb3-type subunit III [Lutibaculum baratangense]|uniref:Cbb3-type cytochrome c oxidase subunit n=1 Tax=Lutibaculum baratangense AMV1 TaxID=631454 RepID=V4RMD9_9HYPH|nr:cytochrome-c oxidase, cbb3-type subunit III [Lutibaculum baratangense]ESR26439.1 Cytochrome c oxidase subunit CcoP [Lutibaculum baratangense AMV1]